MKYLLSIFFAGMMVTASAQKVGYSKVENGIIVYPVNAGAKAVQLKVWGNNIIQVVSSPVLQLKEDTSFIIAADKNAKQQFSIQDAAASVTLSTPLIKAVISKTTGLVNFYTKDGKLITGEKAKSFLTERMDWCFIHIVTSKFWPKRKVEITKNDS